MNRRTISFPSFALTAVLCAPALFGQAAAPAAALPQKMAIIDMQSALISTKDGQKAVADLRTKFGPRNDALQKRHQDLTAKQDQYRKTQNTISDDAKTSLERDIDALTRAIQRDEQDAKEEMDQDQQTMIQQLGAKIMQVLTKYATDNQYTLVFDVSGQPNNILFASNTIDITRDIIALYDKSAPGGTAPSAGPSAGPAPSVAPAPKSPAIAPK